jgi:predicted dehydrogenase
MKNIRKTHLLLVGCGEHSSENLIPTLAGIPYVAVTAICDNSSDALLSAKRWFPSANTIQKAVLDLSDIAGFDAVIVAATPQVHAHIAELCVTSGIPVFVEKPPTVTLEELRRIADLAERNGVITCVGHNLRHSDAAIQFRASVTDPSFGRPVAMEMRYFASKPRGTRWGLASPLRSFLLSHANHAIDLMIYQMGEVGNVVAARAWPDVNGGIALSAQFTFTSGAIGNLLATSYAPHFTLSSSIVSDAGCVAIMDGLHQVRVYDQHPMGKRWGNDWTPRTLETGYRFAGYQTELERFLIAVGNRSTHRGVHPSFRDEVFVYSAMDAIEESIEASFGK